jgi:hypothetical protein
LLVRPGSKRFQIEGYRGPVLYLDDVKEWTAKHPEGGIFVSWQITTRSNSDAAVSFTDYEGPMAGGEVELRLHKYGREWFVTERTLGWVSYVLPSPDKSDYRRSSFQYPFVRLAR